MKVLMYSQMGDGKGGGEMAFTRIGDGLKSREHEVILLFQNEKVPSGECIKEGKRWYINLSVPPTWKLFSCFDQLRRFTASITALGQLLQEVKPDTVNVHFYTEEALLFALLKTIFGYRLVISCHGSDVKNMKWMRRRAAPFILSQADGVTCVSQNLAQKLNDQLPTDPAARVIHNGIDHSFWNVDQEAKREAQREKNIVSVGALRCVKGHDVLLRSFRRVVNQHPQAKLKILGDGPKRREYESLISKTNLSGYVRLMGWCSKEKVREALKEATIFVFPSRHEGFGIALVEAMATGCPIVATKTGGIPEVVGGTDAKLVPPASETALAEALIDALNDKEWRRNAGSASAQRAAEFDWDTAIDKYEEYLRTRRVSSY
jgi:glycosyltransferase involved in cell wall biosynthesis